MSITTDEAQVWYEQFFQTSDMRSDESFIEVGKRLGLISDTDKQEEKTHDYSDI